MDDLGRDYDRMVRGLVIAICMLVGLAIGLCVALWLKS